MGNTFDWELRMERDQMPPAEVLLGGVAVLQECGFSAINPHMGKVTGWINNDGAQFDTLDEAVAETLRAEGSLLHFWKGSFWMEVSYCASLDEPRGLSAYLERLYFRDDEPNRAQIATDMQNLFEGLCRKLQPRWGFALDEWFWDEWHHAKLDMKALYNADPLGRTTYASDAALNETRLAFLKDAARKMERVGSGWMVALYESPWDGYREMLALNQRWMALSD